DATGDGIGPGLGAAYAVDVRCPRLSEYTASHVVDVTIRVIGCLGRPHVGHRIILEGVGELATASIEGTPAHGVEFPVGWKINANLTDPGGRQRRCGCPTAGSRCSGRRRRGAYAAAGEIEFPDASVPVKTAGSCLVFVPLPEAKA